MREILQSYLRKLTNLSGNNRSLNLLRLAVDQFMDIQELDFLNDNPSFSIIENLIAQQNKILLCPESDSRSESNNKVSGKLKKILRTEKFIYEERGARDLYVGWPFIRGKFKDGSLIRAPLLFFPISLQLSGAKWYMVFRSDVGISFNKSFILAYAHFNKTTLDESLLDYNFEDPPEDSRSFRTQLYDLLKESNLEINFNQDLFNDKLINFETFRKKEFEDQEKEGVLKLHPEAVMGIFPQAGSYLVPDYLDLLERPKVPDIEEFFERRSLDDEKDKSAKNNIYRFINKVKEEHTFTPYELDAYQENALKAVKKGNSVVVQGPPGTGKSQLICNLISDFIARGKKVLVVCQKRAALDVVYKRLKEKEIADFVGLVHDFRNDRRLIYQKIASQVDKIPEFQVKNNSLDSIQLERSFLQSSRRIDQINESLEEYKFALYNEEECGISAKELYLTSDIDQPVINLKQVYRFFKFDDLNETIRKFENYFNYALEFDRMGHPWYDRKSFKDFGIEELKMIQEIIHEIPVFHKKMIKDVAGIVNTSVNIEDCESALYKENEINKLIENLKFATVYKYFVHMIGTERIDMDLLWLTNTERVLLDCFKGEGPEISLKTNDLGRFQEVLQRAIRARKNVFKRIHWAIFSKDNFWIKRVIVSNDIKSDKKSLDILIEKIDNRLNFEHNLSKLKENRWLSQIPEGFRKADFQSWFYDQKLALASKLIFDSLRNFKAYFNVAKLTYEEFEQKLNRLLDNFRMVVNKKQEWLKFLTPFQLNHILENPEYADVLIKSLNKDFDSICEFDKISSLLDTNEKEVVAKLFNALEVPQMEELIFLFENSLRLAWLDHIETKYPILRSVSSRKFDQMESEIQDSVSEKLNVSKDILLMKTREITYQDAQYNRLNNRITYKDLYHQVTKKRMIWPIRKVISYFSHELFELIPCWMASPESVSALFPMEEFFDLVIFDEASQCFAEKGIPAMYRGKQIVVAGDNMQLKPNDLYRVRWEDESEDIPELEVDSLLDLACQFLMQLQLQGHYRSKSLDLIEFSNINFYNGNLKLLPDFFDLNNEEPPINYIKVDGIWKNNENEVEALKVVELVKKITTEQPGKEIGIITFNVKQQSLIQDLLDAAVSGDWIIPENMFVKNIENVQGDEKDIIIFSTAYGPNEKGKIIMQFGSLNQAGGENRLNVAITRAREKIIIVSSIHAKDLKVGDTKNQGPKLLKEYLTFAEKVSSGEYTPTLNIPSNYHIQWFLKSKLQELIKDLDTDMELVDELPFTDLSVKDNEAFKALILTDDDIYHQSISVKEPHVFKPFLMNKKKWDFEFFNSRQYWANKSLTKEKLRRFINKVEDKNISVDNAQ